MEGYEKHGLEGLKQESRRPKKSAMQTSPRLASIYNDEKYFRKKRGYEIKKWTYVLALYKVGSIDEAEEKSRIINIIAIHR